VNLQLIIWILCYDFAGSDKLFSGIYYGKVILIFVPMLISLSIFKVPPILSIFILQIAKPNPVPCPSGFGEKNGSKT
jgi:hypothetical protein